MAEYIDRERALSECMRFFKENESAQGDCKSLLCMIPAADVARVVYGEWKRVKNPRWPAHSHDKCSICGWWNTKDALCYDSSRKPGHRLNYCPNCGAKMEGENHEQN